MVVPDTLKKYNNLAMADLKEIRLTAFFNTMANEIAFQGFEFYGTTNEKEIAKQLNTYLAKEVGKRWAECIKIEYVKENGGAYVVMGKGNPNNDGRYYGELSLKYVGFEIEYCERKILKKKIVGCKIESLLPKVSVYDMIYPEMVQVDFARVQKRGKLLGLKELLEVTCIDIEDFKRIYEYVEENDLQEVIKLKDIW